MHEVFYSLHRHLALKSILRIQTSSNDMHTRKRHWPYFVSKVKHRIHTEQYIIHLTILRIARRSARGPFSCNAIQYDASWMTALDLSAAMNALLPCPLPHAPSASTCPHLPAHVYIICRSPNLLHQILADVNTYCRTILTGPQYCHV